VAGLGARLDPFREPNPERGNDVVAFGASIGSPAVRRALCETGAHASRSRARTPHPTSWNH